jgi:hypothetical protein
MIQRYFETAFSRHRQYWMNDWGFNCGWFNILARQHSEIRNKQSACYCSQRDSIRVYNMKLMAQTSNMLASYSATARDNCLL